jgi:hypothetical protein
MDRHAVERPKWPRFFGDWGWLKIFPTGDAAIAWFAEHDPEGVVFQCSIEPAGPRRARDACEGENAEGQAGLHRSLGPPLRLVTEPAERAQT